MVVISVYTKWYRAIRKSLIEYFGGHCGKCGKKLNRQTADFAHFKDTDLNSRGRGSWHRIHDVMRNPTCYWLACHFCHEEYDRNRGDWRGQKNA